jgi:hypothetical protein
VTAFSCASRGRPEHGTSRTSPHASPGTQAAGLDYYKNLTRRDFESSCELDQLFAEYRFWDVRTSFDLYFVGIRSGELGNKPPGSVPSTDRVARIAALMPLPHRALRWPLRLMLMSLPDSLYQPAAIRYWRVQERAQEHPSLAGFRRERLHD